jgi:polyisoprenoid-binding protein YceI
VPLLVATLALLLLAPLGDGLAKDEEEAGPSINFVGRNAIAKAKGTFHSWRIVRADIDPAQPELGVVEVEVDIESIDTGIGRRDDHLRSEDFFDVEKYPKAAVRVFDARPAGTSERGLPLYRADFEVSIRDVSKILKGQFEVVSTSPPTVEGSLMLNRVDFGVGKGHSRWNPMSVKEEIPLTFFAVLEPAP